MTSKLPIFATLPLLLFTLGKSTISTAGFVDVTVEAGLDYVQWSCVDCPESELEPYHMTGGACAADFDADGWVDLYASRLGDADLLFLNQGDGTFVDRASTRGLDLVDDTNGVACADVDGDGDVDVFVTTVGGRRSYLFENDGTGSFVEAADRWGVDQLDTRPPYIVRAGMSASFGDYDLDGWLDLHTSEWSVSGGSWTRLYRNTGEGRFEDVTASAGIDTFGVWAFTGRWADVDDDGWPELLQAADFISSQLYRNLGDGTFDEVTGEVGVGTDENGMGSAVGDYDGDGDLDWFVSSIDDPADTCASHPCGWFSSGNRLYRNRGDGTFEDATDAAGIRNGGWGWGATFVDVDNDGDLDLAQTNGFDLPQTDLDAAFNSDRQRLWINDGLGVFTDRSGELGFAATGLGRGLLQLDYDRDGAVDLLVVDHRDGARLYRNTATEAHAWLRVSTRGVRSNRDGVGSRVWITAGDPARTQMREMSASSGFLAQDERVAHFGLGPGVEQVERVVVTWPASGYRQERLRVSARQWLTVRETDGTGDRDGDLDRDLIDLDGLVECLSGPQARVDPEACAAFDADFDGDVDLADYAAFQLRYGGTTVGGTE